jgi:hypothetical protein
MGLLVLEIYIPTIKIYDIPIIPSSIYRWPNMKLMVIIFPTKSKKLNSRLIKLFMKVERPQGGGT